MSLRGRSGRAARALTVSFMAGTGLAGSGMLAGASAAEFQPKARLHLDYAAHDADRRQLADDFSVRRARIGFEAGINPLWSVEATYDFAGEEFKTVALEYEGWRAGDITIGQSKLPFSLGELESSGDMSLAERALPLEAFVPARRLGVTLQRNGRRYTAAAMIFGSTIDGDQRGRGIAGRFSYTPVHSGAQVVHLGIGAIMEKPREAVDIDAAPESRVADVDLVNTGKLDGIDRIDRIGLELAGRSGSLSLQGEWVHLKLDRSRGMAAAALDGWYVQGSWVLTGEMRAYKNGRFKGILPSRRAGALELTARYSHVDLDDGDVRGGQESNWTLGLNYHLNRHAGIMANYIQVRSTRRGVEDDPGIAQLRAWFEF